jgi:rsbT co-antagonist protein RsbR
MAVARETIYDTQDVAELRRYIRELEDRLRQFETATITAPTRADDHFVQTLFDYTPVGLTLQRLDGSLLDVNPAFTRLIGYSREEIIQFTTINLTAPEYAQSDKAQVELVRTTGAYGPYEKAYLRRDGKRVPVRMHGRLVERDGETLIWSTIEDISDRIQIEANRRKAIYQEELIRAQEAALEELSTPLMPIGDRLLVMPLIGAIDQARAERIVTTLLAGVQRQRALTTIIDVTGVTVMDTYVASALTSAAQSARLIGCRVLLTGIGPEVAQILVSLGVDLNGIATFATLQQAVAASLHVGSAKRVV